VANTAVPTVSAIGATGATARFVDIDPVTYLMDVSKAEKAITSKTKCIIAVHLFGQCVDMDPLLSIASRRNIPILEDCSQSHGALYKGRISGSLTEISAFSFYPTKILGGYGDGGMVLTTSEELEKKLRRLRFYGMVKTYYSIDEGFNSRLDELHAAILLKKMNHIDQYLQRRREIAKVYNERLKNTSLILPAVGNGNLHSYYLYVVRHQQRDEIMEKLKNRSILLNISYPWPIHTMSGYKHLGYSEGDLPHTEKAAKEIFSLPMYPSLTNQEQEYVIDSLLDIIT
jgi:aminotransferase EvaB